MKHTRSQPHRGFTLVELVIVIAVIAILASVVIVTYGGVKQRSVAASLSGDLAQAASEMEVIQTQIGDFPDEIPDTVKPSDGVTLTLQNNEVSDVQNGALYQRICSDLLEEGYGKGKNNGGGTEVYITFCQVKNRDHIHINGWNSAKLYIPVGKNDLRDWFNSDISYNSYRPNHKTVVLEFAEELNRRFINSGGYFPITTFWDDWAGPSNSGVPYEEPPANLNLEEITYCIEAVHAKYPDMVWRVKYKGVPEEGGC